MQVFLYGKMFSVVLEGLIITMRDGFRMLAYANCVKYRKMIPFIFHNIYNSFSNIFVAIVF